jgi:hypothetical protein
MLLIVSTMEASRPTYAIVQEKVADDRSKRRRSPTSPTTALPIHAFELRGLPDVLSGFHQGRST